MTLFLRDAPVNWTCRCIQHMLKRIRADFSVTVRHCMCYIITRERDEWERERERWERERERWVREREGEMRERERERGIDERERERYVCVWERERDEGEREREMRERERERWGREREREREPERERWREESVFPACVLCLCLTHTLTAAAADVCHLLSLSFSSSVQQQKIIPGSFGAQKEQIFMTKVQVRRLTWEFEWRCWIERVRN